MPLIYCNINIFDYDQSVYVVDGEHTHLIAKVPFQELGKTMPELCNDKGIYDIHLSCSVPGMAKQAAEAIYAEASKKYGFANKLDIEVH